MDKRTRYSPEVRDRAVRLVLEHQQEHGSQWQAIRSIAAKMGCTAESLRRWVRQAERDEGRRPGLTTTEQQRVKELEYNSARWAFGGSTKVGLRDLGRTSGAAALGVSVWIADSYFEDAPPTAWSLIKEFIPFVNQRNAWKQAINACFR